MNANLPSWNGLLKNLAISIGMNDENIENLNEFDILDQPTIIENRFRQKYGYEEGKKLFKKQIADQVNSDYFALMHSLLVGLNVNEAVTTNYECLYERAFTSTNNNSMYLHYSIIH